MASEVEICNRALQKLGAARINALSDTTRNARSCNAAYAACRDAELRAHTWNFAIARVQLAADATAPAFGRTNAFTLPADFLRILPRDPLENLNDRDWQIEGRKLLTDEDAPFDLRYVKQETDPNQFDALFRESLAARLALELCEEITQSNTKKAELKNDYKLAIAEARRTNAIENVPAVAAEDTWISERA